MRYVVTERADLAPPRRPIRTRSHQRRAVVARVEPQTNRCPTSMDREGKMANRTMANRTREFRVEVRKLPKRARARPLVGQRARPTPERMHRAGADFERGFSYRRNCE